MILQVTPSQLEEALPFTWSSEINFYLSRLKERSWMPQLPACVPARLGKSATISWVTRTCRLGQQLWQSVQKACCCSSLLLEGSLLSYHLSEWKLSRLFLLLALIRMVCISNGRNLIPPRVTGFHPFPSKIPYICHTKSRKGWICFQWWKLCK